MSHESQGGGGHSDVEENIRQATEQIVGETVEDVVSSFILPFLMLLGAREKTYIRKRGGGGHSH